MTLRYDKARYGVLCASTCAATTCGLALRRVCLIARQAGLLGADLGRDEAENVAEMNWGPRPGESGPLRPHTNRDPPSWRRLPRSCAPYRPTSGEAHQTQHSAQSRNVSRYRRLTASRLNLTFTLSGPHPHDAEIRPRRLTRSQSYGTFLVKAAARLGDCLHTAARLGRM